MITQPHQNFNPQSDFPDQIEVLEVQHLIGRSAVKASCRVRIGQVVISGIKVILPALANHPFVGMPNRKHGTSWEPMVSFLSPTLEEAVTTEVLAAWGEAFDADQF
jgi:hypothetical protein